MKTKKLSPRCHSARRPRTPNGPFGGTQLVALGGLSPFERRIIADLDAVLSTPNSHQDLPQVVNAFDPELGSCRPVRWDNKREPIALRRTALAIAQHEAMGDRNWELN